MSDSHSRLFTVVITHYRQTELWQDAVSSVLEQDYPHVQLVFADDGTPGFDPASVSNYVALHNGGNMDICDVAVNPENRGTVRTLNMAEAYVKGDYIYHFAADDALCDSCVLSRLAAKLEESDDDDLGVYGCMIPCDGKMRPIVNDDPFFSSETLHRLGAMSAHDQYRELILANGNQLPLGASAFIVDRFKKYLPFDERNRLNEDYPFSLRVSRNGWHMTYADTPVLRYRRGGISTSEKPSPSRKVFLGDHVRTCEFEIMPYMDEYLSIDEQAMVFSRYLDDIAKFQLDDKLDEPGCLERITDYMKDHPEVSAAFDEKLIRSLSGCKRDNDHLRENLAATQDAVDSFKTSASWKAGRLVTFIPRCVKRLISR